jgi:hypothetical protein
MAKALLLEKIAPMMAPLWAAGIQTTMVRELAKHAEQVARLIYLMLVFTTIQLALAEVMAKQTPMVKTPLYRRALVALPIQIALAGTIMHLVVVSRSSFSIYF